MALLGALAVSAGLGLIRCAGAQAAGGGSVVVQPGAPGEASKRLPEDTKAVAPARSEADIAFMQGMILHHSQAVEMTALIPTHTTDAQVRLLGAKISRSQSDEMQFMKRWLALRGEPLTLPMSGMSGMGMSGGGMMTYWV